MERLSKHHCGYERSSASGHQAVVIAGLSSSGLAAKNLASIQLSDDAGADSIWTEALITQHINTVHPQGHAQCSIM